jgi:hypothetical protein
MRTPWWIVLVVCGCSNKLSSDVSINGKQVSMSSCRNGVVYGYRGVELTTDDGSRLRIASTLTGEPEVVYMPAGSDRGATLGKCGTFSIEDQNSTINDVKNVKGKVTLDCTADGVTLKGTASFENCH